MAPPTSRAEILSRLRAQLSAGHALLGAGAGIGLSAKFVERGGADLIIVYNSGRFRMAGRGSLAGLMPYGDANAVVVEMAREVLPVVTRTPVLAGVCGTDPFRRMGDFLPQLRDLGFAGVQNFPTVGLIDGRFRRELEDTGMGYGREVDMVRQAHALDLLTAPYVFDAAQGRAMAAAGADLVVVHLGLTTGGSIGAKAAEGASREEALARAVDVAQEIRDACVEVREDVIVLVHGGPVSSVEDARWVLERTVGVQGFFGASSLERLPVETALGAAARAFKAIKPRL